MGIAMIFGASFGLATQLLANGFRKQPLMRHPWEHVLLMGIGAYLGNALAEWEDKLKADIEKKQETAMDTNRRRFRGTVRALPE